MALADVSSRRRSAPMAPEPLEVLLRELLNGQRRIIALLEQRRRPKADPVSDRALLTAIAGSNPAGACFSVGELLAHSVVNTELRRALSSSGLMNARRLGNKFRALAGLDINGFVLRRVARDESGCIWQLLHTASRDGADNGV